MSIKQFLKTFPKQLRKIVNQVPISLSVFEFFAKKRENVSNGLRDGKIFVPVCEHQLQTPSPSIHPSTPSATSGTQGDRGLCSFFCHLCIFLGALAPFSLFAPFAQDTIIVLAPYADPRSPGRTINGAFERGIALQCAEKIKTELEQRVPHATVVIARPTSSGATNGATTDLATASFSNTLGASYFFALSFYQETSPQPHVNLYRYTYESDLPLNNTELSLCPYDHVYRLHVNESIALTKNLCAGFSAQHDIAQRGTTQQGIVCAPPCALPVKTLVGVAAPAALIEVGIPHDYAWQQLVEPLAAGVAHALTH